MTSRSARGAMVPKVDGKAVREDERRALFQSRRDVGLVDRRPEVRRARPIIITSAATAASATATEGKPSERALSRLGPGRPETITLTSESRRFSACARP